MSDVDLKQQLLSFGFFIDNEALDTYIELMSTAKNNSKLDLLGYSEWHHVIPVACYKQKYKCKNRQQALSYADKDSTNMKVALLYKDHCRAHYLLYLCTKGHLKHANAETVSYMFRAYPALTKPQNSSKLFEYKAEDFIALQNYFEEVRNDAGSRFWTQDEIEFLKTNYSQQGVQYCADALGKTYATVKSKARDLGLTVDVSRHSEETKQFIREYYPQHGTRFCAEALNLPLNIIKALVAQLNVKMTKWWTQEELDFLVSSYEKLGRQECARHLQRSEGSVVTKACKLGLTKDLGYTIADKQFIIEHYPKEGIQFCADALNRTPEAIQHYAKTLGVRRPPQGQVIYCPELDKQFKSIKEASIQLQMSDGNICGVLHKRSKSCRGLTFYRGTREEYLNEKESCKNQFRCFA